MGVSINLTEVIILQYIYQIIMLYALNMYSFVCQFNINTAEKVK